MNAETLDSPSDGRATGQDLPPARAKSIDRTSYSFTNDEAVTLRSAALLPLDLRVKLLTMYLNAHDPAALVNLFAQFIGAANSVAENCKEYIALEAMVSGVSEDPYISEKLNMPTMEGAMQGVILSRGVDPKKACGGCAYRLGAIANQCFVTVTDAQYVIDDDADFLCHEDLGKDGSPSHLCIGHAMRRAKAAS